MLLRLSEKDKKNNYYLFGGSKNQILDIRKKTKNKNIFFHHIYLI